MSFGGGPASANLLTVRVPSIALPLGRITVIGERSMPAPRQPSMIAPPMLPHPTNQVGLGNISVSAIYIPPCREAVARGTVRRTVEGPLRQACGLPPPHELRSQGG